MDNNLLEILACPVCKGELLFAAEPQILICKFDRLAYPIVKGVPILIPDQARRLMEDEC